MWEQTDKQNTNIILTIKNNRLDDDFDQHKRIFITIKFNIINIEKLIIAHNMFVYILGISMCVHNFMYMNRLILLIKVTDMTQV